MILRKAVKEDIKEIDKIYCEGTFDEVRIQFPKKTEKEIMTDLNQHKKERLSGFDKGTNSKSEYLVVAEEHKKIIAFGQAGINKDDKKKAMIEKVYVSKEYKGRGIASTLMENMLVWLKERGVKSVSSGIFVNNVPSIKLHEKFGFKITAVRMQKKFKK